MSIGEVRNSGILIKLIRLIKREYQMEYQMEYKLSQSRHILNKPCLDNTCLDNNSTESLVLK